MLFVEKTRIFGRPPEDATVATYFPRFTNSRQ